MKIDVPIVAVINASEDTVDALTVFFQQQGFRTASKIWPAREPLDRDLALAFMSQHQPHVVVFDISFPYDRNYSAFESSRKLETNAAFRSS